MEAVEQLGNVRVLEFVRALLDLVLVIDVAIGYGRAVGAVRPDQVEHVVDVLQVHAQPLEAVGDLAQHRPALQAASLLEVGELGDLHPVQPHFPAQAPGAERSEEHTSELQSLMRISYAVFCLKKKKKTKQ